MSTAIRFREVAQPLIESISATKVNYRKVGKSGLRVSSPVLGTMGFGDTRWLNWMLDTEQVDISPDTPVQFSLTRICSQALPILNSAYLSGINTWDTANTYSNGESERIIGSALKEYKIPRHSVVIMTKCYRPVADGDASAVVAFADGIANQSKDYVNQFGLSRSAIFRAVEASLRRLDTDYIDILQIHRYDSSVPPEETLKALDDLVTSGQVRYIGASSMWAYQFATFQSIAERRGWTKFISMQNHYNLLYREEEREMNKFCNETGVGLFPWSPLAGGHLARPPKSFGTTTRSAGDAVEQRFSTGQSGPDKEIIKRVQELAQKRDWTMSQVSLAWLNRRVTAPVVGLSSIARVEEVLALRGKALTEDEEAYLEEPYEPKCVQGHS